MGVFQSAYRKLSGAFHLGRRNTLLGFAIFMISGGPASALDPFTQPETNSPIAVTMTALQFTSDYNTTSHTYGMLDNDVDWKPTGNVLAKPDWIPADTDGNGGRNNPISHPMDTKVTVRLTLEVSPAVAAAGNYHLIGSVNGKPLPGFYFDDWVNLTGGTNKVSVTSARPLPREIADVSHSIQWNLYSAAPGHVMSQTTGPHEILCTYGQVNDEKQISWYVSIYRTRSAIAHVKGAPLKPLDLVMKAMDVKFKPDTSAALNDAWLAGEPDSPGYDCIGLARWVSNVAHQLGISSDTVQVQAEYVTATWEHPDVPLEIPFTGPFPDNSVPGHPNWQVVLSSAPGRYMSFEGSVKITDGNDTIYVCPGFGPNETPGIRKTALSIIHTYKVLGACNLDDPDSPTFIPHFNYKKGGYGTPPPPSSNQSARKPIRKPIVERVTQR